MKTCRAGHPRTPENTYVSKRGIVYCRRCRVLRSREYTVRNLTSLRVDAIRRAG